MRHSRVTGDHYSEFVVSSRNKRNYRVAALLGFAAPPQLGVALPTRQVRLTADPVFEELVESAIRAHRKLTGDNMTLQAMIPAAIAYAMDIGGDQVLLLTDDLAIDPDKNTKVVRLPPEQEEPFRKLRLHLKETTTIGAAFSREGKRDLWSERHTLVRVLAAYCRHAERAF